MDRPETPRRMVRKTIGGVTFDDPYAWLQPDTADVLAWQAEHVRATVDTVSAVPGFDDLVDDVRGCLPDANAALAAKTLIAGRWFWLGVNDDASAQAIRVGEKVDDPGRVLVDGTDLSDARADGRSTMIGYLRPSPDGRLLAFNESAGGDPAGLYRVVEVDTGRFLEANAPALQGNLLVPDWLPDGSGFFLGCRTDGHHGLRFVAVAESAADWTTESFDPADVPLTSLGVAPQVSPGGCHVLAVTVPHDHIAGVLGDLETGTWRRFAPLDFAGELYGEWWDDDTYIAIATDHPRGRVVAIPVETSTDPTTWRELIAPSELVLRAVRIVSGRLVVSALNDVALDVRVHELDGTEVGAVELPPASASFGMVIGRVQPRSDAFVFSASSFARSDTTYHLDVATLRLDEIEPGHELPNIRVEQFFATSADGTRIPYFVVTDTTSDARSPRPTLVNAYGGFNIPWIPAFLGTMTPFVRAGGAFVRANLRGGSEYGRDWYEAGRLNNKANVFADLRAVATDLIARGFATPELLAFHGTSNGGLLAGVAITQQPDLWRAVVAHVPVLDVLEQVEDGPGADLIRSVYAQDYGDPDNPADAANLYSYSPYHNVVAPTAYPAALLVFGQHDIGCPPYHGRKMTAALRHASTSEHPVLLRVWEDVGHGSLDPAISARQYAEILAFVMSELGMDVRR